jgi:hypothetical protein
VILERPFDGLVEEVGSEQFIYICMQELSGEWLEAMVKIREVQQQTRTHHEVWHNAIAVPESIFVLSIGEP